MNPELFLAIAYFAVFGAIGVYLQRLAARRRDLERKIQQTTEPGRTVGE